MEYTKEDIINLLRDINKDCNDMEYAAIVLVYDDIPIIGKFATGQDGEWDLVEVVKEL